MPTLKLVVMLVGMYVTRKATSFSIPVQALNLGRMTSSTVLEEEWQCYSWVTGNIWKETDQDLFWPPAWQTWNTNGARYICFCGLHTDSLAEAAAKPRVGNANRRARPVLQGGWLKREAVTSSEAEVENINFSKLAKYMGALWKLFIFRVDVLQYGFLSFFFFFKKKCL